MKRLFKGLLLFGIATVMTACGDEQEITKKDENTNETSSNGVLTKGEFSVSPDKKVRFSMGNLQYQASTGTWRFSEHQWDFVGDEFDGTVYENDEKCNNANISEMYDGWIDLFGWGTSGYNGKYPYMTSENDEDYGDGEKNIAGTKYDWGVYNKISNGGDKAGVWRTLTYDEWMYLIDRTNGLGKNKIDLFGIGYVNDIKGMILLPDDWKQPESLEFTSDLFCSGNYHRLCYQNDYSLKEWEIMEANGAVFLPAGGSRYEDVTVGTRIIGNLCYWSTSTGYNCLSGRDFDVLVLDPEYFKEDHSDSRFTYASSGCSVRLVQDVQ